MDDQLKLGELNIPVSMDFREMERQRKTVLKDAVNRAGKEMAKGMKDAGGKSAEAFLQALEERYAARALKSRLALARGVISKKEFEKQGREAAEAMNRAIIEEIDSRSAKGDLSKTDLYGLASGLQETGEKGAQSVRDELGSLNTWIRGTFVVGAIAALGILATSAARVFNKVADTIKDVFLRAGDRQEVEERFRNLTIGTGFDPDRLLGKLQAALRGTVSEMTLFKLVNQAIQADLPKTEEQLERLFLATRRLAESTPGREVPESLERMVNGIAKLETEILEELGILTTLQVALRDWEIQTGRNSDKLTQQEKITIFFNRVLEEAERKVGRLGEESETASRPIEQLAAFIENVKDRTSEAVAESPRILSFLTELGDKAANGATGVEQIALNVGSLVDALVELSASRAPAVRWLSSAIGEGFSKTQFGEALLGGAIRDGRKFFEQARTLRTIGAETDQASLRRQWQETFRAINGALRAGNDADGDEIKSLSGQLEAIANRLHELKTEAAQAEALVEAAAEERRAREAAAAARVDAEAQKEHAKEAKRAKADLERLNEDLDNKLAALTSTSIDNARLALDSLIAEMREKYATLGQDVPADVEAGFLTLRDNLAHMGQIEGLESSLQQIRDLGEETPETVAALRDLLQEVQIMASGVEEGSQAKEDLADVERQVTREIDRQTQAMERRTKAREREEEAAKQEERRKARLIRQNARDLKGSIDSALRLAEGVGLIESNAAKALTAIGEIAVTIKAIRDTKGLEGRLGFGAALPGILSAGTALVGVISGFVGGRREEERKQVAAMVELRSALEELTDAVLADVSQAEQSELVSTGSLIEKIAKGFRANGFREFELTDEGLLAQLKKIQELTGSNFLEGNTVNVDRFLLAFEAFKDLDLGSFGKDVEGRLDALNFKIQALGDAAGSGEEQFESFLETLKDLPETSQFATELERAWREGGPAAVRALLQEAAVGFADGGVDGVADIFGSKLDAESIQRLIQEGLRFAGNAGAPGSSNDFTQTRSITEVTGNRIAGTLTTIEDHVRAIRERGAGQAPLYIPPPFYETGRLVQSNEVNVSFGAMMTGDIHVTATGGQIDKAAIFEVMEEGAALTARRISEELAKERRRELSRRGRH